MQLDDYIRVLVRRWYIPLIVLAVAAGGAWMYNRITGTNTAESIVAVPVSSLVRWDATFSGQELTERIAESLDDGTTSDELRGSYAGEFRFETGRLTPQFAVRADSDDPDRAILVADTAVEEALRLFEESRRARTDYVLAAYQEQLDEAQLAAVEARRELDRFLIANNGYALPSRIAEQSDLVSELRQQVELAGIVASDEGTGSESPELTAAREELDRLLGLEPELGQLELDVRLAESAVSRSEAEASALNVAGEGYATALAAVEERLEEERAELMAAESALADFKEANGTEDLAAAISEQQSVVNGLLLSEVSDSGASSAARALAAAEATLLEMEAALPEYNRLTEELSDAQGLLALREQQQTFLEGISPLEDQVEVVEPAALVSGLWWTIIRYTVAVLLGLFISMTAIYLLTLFERRPVTVEDLEREFTAPVVASIPKGS
jgi:hypothetical protein